MKIKTIKTTTEHIEVDINFPSFYERKEYNIMVKLISENKCIEISLLECFPEISYREMPIIGGDIISYYNEITEEKFLEKYNQVESILRQKLA